MPSETHYMPTRNMFYSYLDFMCPLPDSIQMCNSFTALCLNVIMCQM